MVEDIGLYTLVGHPILDSTEEIKLHRNTMIGGLQLANHADKLLVHKVTFGEDSREGHLVTGMLDESLMDKDEKLFQQLWKTYFKAICIKERLNPRKHRQDMPVRYWKYLTEKQQ